MVTRVDERQLQGEEYHHGEGGVDGPLHVLEAPGVGQGQAQVADAEERGVGAAHDAEVGVVQLVPVDYLGGAVAANVLRGFIHEDPQGIGRVEERAVDPHDEQTG